MRALVSFTMSFLKRRQIGIQDTLFARKIMNLSRGTAFVPVRLNQFPSGRDGCPSAAIRAKTLSNKSSTQDTYYGEVASPGPSGDVGGDRRLLATNSSINAADANPIGTGRAS